MNKCGAYTCDIGHHSPGATKISRCKGLLLLDLFFFLTHRTFYFGGPFLGFRLRLRHLLSLLNGIRYTIDHFDGMNILLNIISALPPP